MRRLLFAIVTLCALGACAVFGSSGSTNGSSDAGADGGPQRGAGLSDGPIGPDAGAPDGTVGPQCEALYSGSFAAAPAGWVGSTKGSGSAISFDTKDSLSAEHASVTLTMGAPAYAYEAYSVAPGDSLSTLTLTYSMYVEDDWSNADVYPGCTLILTQTAAEAATLLIERDMNGNYTAEVITGSRASVSLATAGNVPAGWYDVTILVVAPTGVDGGLVGDAGSLNATFSMRPHGGGTAVGIQSVPGAFVMSAATTSVTLNCGETIYTAPSTGAAVDTWTANVALSACR